MKLLNIFFKRIVPDSLLKELYRILNIAQNV